MKRILWKWAIELVWAGGWILMSLIYFSDKYSVKCEQCLDFRCCGPCETLFMTHFGSYMTVFQAIIVGAMIVRRVLSAPPRVPEPPGFRG